MNKWNYSLFVDDVCCASYMELDTALILAGALAEKYYAEPDLQIKIVRICTATEEVRLNDIGS